MGGLGVAVAIIREGKVLLIQREDFEVWALPAGEIDPGETPAATAVREAKEETGFDVRLTRFVGLYTIPAWSKFNAHTALFAAEIVGGELTATTEETRDARFFGLDELPEDMLWWYEQRIRDAFNGIGGSAVWTQDLQSPMNHLSRHELYAARDQSDLSRSDYFRQIAPRGREAADLEGIKVE